MSTAKTLGTFRRQLVAEGFDNDTADDIVTTYWRALVEPGAENPFIVDLDEGTPRPAWPR